MLLHFILQQTGLSSEDKGLVGRMIRYLDDHLVLVLGRIETDKMLDSLLGMMTKIGDSSQELQDDSSRARGQIHRLLVATAP